jgi:hypothetical protein
MLERIDLANLHQDALVLAKGNEIDLLAAYSVLLGVFNLDAARDGCDPNLSPSTEASDAGADNDYDHAFVDAIKSGYLSPEQAMARGNRDAFAGSLAKQHRLTQEQAFAVTDNRIPLLAAIRTRKPKARINLDTQRRRVSVPLVVAAAVIVVVAIFVVLTRNSNDTVDSGAQPGPARTELSSVESE